MGTQNRIGLEAVLITRQFEKGLKQYLAGQKKITSTTQKTSQSAKKNTDLLGQSFTTLGKKIVAFGATFLTLTALKDFGVQSFQAAAQAERLGLATDNLGKRFGVAGSQIVQSIQEASGFTISKLDAMQQANNAMLLGVVQSEDEFAKLTEVAVTLGNAMGQSATKSVSDLTLALGRQSPLILDNLGISLKLSEAYEAEAQSLNKTVSELTDAEKKQAFFNEALRRGQEAVTELGGVQETTATKTERLASKFADVKLAVGELITETGKVDDALDKTVSTLDKLINAIEETKNLTKQTADVEKILGRELTRAEKALLDSGRATGEVAAALKILNQQFLPIILKGSEVAGAIKVIAEAEDDLTESTWDATRALDAQTARLTGLAAAYSGFGPLAEGGFADFTRTEPGETLKVEADIDTGAITKSIGDGLQAVKSAIGQVSGLTFDEVLPVQETFRVDEWVRRLQAVATDGKNEWTTALVEQFGGQEFFRPFEDAVASGDPGAISEAAEGLINGPFLLELMDIEGAVAEAESLLAEMELQQRINDAILAAMGGEGGELPGAGGESPITSLLGIGEGGDVQTGIDNLTGTALPSMGAAYTTFTTTATTETGLLSNQINTVMVTALNNVVLKLDLIIKKFGELKKPVEDLGKSISEKLTPKINEATTAAIKLAEALERAARARVSAGAESGAATGIGFRYGVGFQSGTSPLGFRVPAGFPNDTFPINVTSGERIVVSPPGRSIEQVIGGRGDVNVSFTGPINIASRNDLEMFASRVSRQVTQELN